MFLGLNLCKRMSLFLVNICWRRVIVPATYFQMILREKKDVCVERAKGNMEKCKQLVN